jgi:hypothetical protein
VGGRSRSTGHSAVGLPGPGAAARATAAAQSSPALFPLDAATAGGLLGGGADGDPGAERNGARPSQSGRACRESAPPSQQQPGPRRGGQQKTLEDAREGLSGGDVFYAAAEFQLSGLPTLRAMGSPQGQPVMRPTPAPPPTQDGLGAVDEHTGATVVLLQRHQRRHESAELVDALLPGHPHDRQGPARAPGIMPGPRRMLRARSSCGPRPDDWCGSPSQPPVPGSLRGNCCGVSSAGR